MEKIAENALNLNYLFRNRLHFLKKNIIEAKSLDGIMIIFCI